MIADTRSTTFSTNWSIHMYFILEHALYIKKIGLLAAFYDHSNAL